MKVRLKLNNLSYSSSETFLFQFHEGPIKTMQNYSPANWHYRFNSMKVRLKHIIKSERLRIK